MFHLNRASGGQAPATPAASWPARPAAQLRGEQPAGADPLGGGLRDERGRYSEMSVEDIIVTAGVSRRTFYLGQEAAADMRARLSQAMAA
jgi:hypothetical protein